MQLIAHGRHTHLTLLCPVPRFFHNGLYGVQAPLMRVHLGGDSTQLNHVLLNLENAHLTGSVELSIRLLIASEQGAFKFTLLLLQMQNVSVLLGKG